MKKLILIFLVSSLFCQETETQQQKRAFLVETNMTREELESLINQGEAAKFEEGKLASVESKIEKDDDDDDDDDDKRQEHLQEDSTTSFLKKNTKQKISFFNYVFAFLIVVVLLNLYVYGSQRRRLMKSNNFCKNNLNEYILLDNHVY